MTLPVITGPAALPPARIGIEYGLANITATGTGVLPFTWALAGQPAGMAIDAATGKFSGIITADCGPYMVTLTLLDASDSPVSVILPLFVSNMPNGFDLLKRLPYETLKGCTLDYLNAVAAASLKMIADWTGCPIDPTACTAPVFTDEVLPVKSFTRRSMPLHHPVLEIIEATSGTTKLEVGTFRQVQEGSKGIAITDEGDSVTLRETTRRDGYGTFFITYRAGLNPLPPDLLEVMVYLSGLLFRERDRVGISKLIVGEGTTEYFRELPWPLQSVVNGYRRVALYV